MAKEKISPGMQQYLDIKENYRCFFAVSDGGFLRIILRGCR